MGTRGGQRHGTIFPAVGGTLGLLALLLPAPPASARAASRVFYARSTDGGASFGDSANLSSDAAMSELAQVAADAGTVHVVWREGDDGEVVYRRSPDGGVGFEAPVNLSRTEGDSAEPDLAVTGDRVHVVWAEAFLDDQGRPDPAVDGDEIYGRSSTDRGATFGARGNVSGTADRHTRDPDIAATGTFVAVAFEDALNDTDDDVFSRRSTDGGKSWMNPADLSRDPLQQVGAALAVSGTDVHAVWEDRRADLDESDDRVGYARSDDGGETFSAALLLPAEVPSRRPSVAASGQVVHVVSCIPADPAGLFDSEVLYHRSTDRGATWEPPVNLSGNPGDCGKPRVVAAGHNVYVAWSDTTTGRSDIFLRRSADDGATFQAVQNVSRTRGSSDDVSLAVDAANGFVYVVWTDFSIETPPATKPPGSAPRGVRAEAASGGQAR